jgi:hypothetical protein
MNERYLLCCRGGSGGGSARGSRGGSTRSGCKRHTLSCNRQRQFSKSRYANETYDTPANSLRVCLSICQVRTRAGVSDTDGGAIDERLTTTETGVVRLAARAKVCVSQAGDCTTCDNNQVSISCNK